MNSSHTVVSCRLCHRALYVCQSPDLQAVFQTEAISLMDWLAIIALTSIVLWVDEIRKLCGSKVSATTGRGRQRVGATLE